MGCRAAAQERRCWHQAAVVECPLYVGFWESSRLDMLTLSLAGHDRWRW